MKRSIKILSLVAILCVGISAVVIAAENIEKITASLNYGITIKYNGVTQQFKDATGSSVYPISYNGTTYLPVRAVSNLVGLPVEWDGANNTVLLGNDGSKTDITTLSAKATKYSWIIKDANELTVSGSDANMTYNSGIAFDIWNHSSSTSKSYLMYFPTNGKNTITFTAWTNANDTKVFVFNENYEVIDKFDMKANQFISKTLNISGCSKIAFGADTSDYKTESEVLKIFEPTIYNK